MLIIDSLLIFIFFSLERCRRTSLFLLLSRSAQSNGMGSQSTGHNLYPSYE
jgi:hypothetical protein